MPRSTSQLKSSHLESQTEEIQELEQKLQDLELELAMPAAEFERKLAERLREEIKVNKQKIDEDFKRELQEEKKRILA